MGFFLKPSTKQRDCLQVLVHTAAGKEREEQRKKPRSSRQHSTETRDAPTVGRGLGKEH